ncbi:DHC-9 protein [Gonium pectorale]|uniref:Dynein axonemal heavy chain 7 n=1 Tax=Gonium pectorale TaxID=33097 RepID=A0A150GEC6_GONPE|nr:DHC-9 protein [Gonium pectorale]|eukprot:KXZ48211.1 DHC-9 protein [Gonium pectorale]
MAAEIVAQRRKLPPLLNDRSLFTRAAPYGNKDDPFYHSPSNRIGNNFSPQSMRAAAILFEEFPQDANAPRTRGKAALQDVRSSFASSRPLSPRATLPPLNGTGTNGHTSPASSPEATGRLTASKRPAADLDIEGENRWRSTKAARAAVAGVPLDQLVDAVLRYHYYVEIGVDGRHVAPFREEWAGNALGMVPAAPPFGVSQAYYDSLIRSSLEETHAEYVIAMKRSMVDYVISSPVERHRLNLQPLEPLLAIPSPTQECWRAVVERQLLPSWHADVDTARAEVAWTLQTLSANALELSRLWHSSRFSAALLVDVASPEFVMRLPLAADTFYEQQSEVMELVKGQLWSSWAPKSLEVFNRIPPVFINGDADAYYRSIATLQSNQLRGLVQRSLDSYVALFEKHPPRDEVDPQQDRLMWSVPPVFVLDLVEVDGKPSYKPTFQECEDIVRNILDNMVLSVAGLPRVGSNSVGSASFTPPMPGTLIPPSSSTIPTTSLQEESVVTAKKAVLQIMERNAVAPKLLAAMFEDWMWLISEDAALAVRAFCERQPEPSLAEFQAEIDRLRAAADAVRVICTDDVRTGIYIVRCRAFKDLLASSAEQLIYQLLEYLRNAVRTSNLKIHEEYQIMTGEVGKTSNNAEELLALKKYIAKCSQDQERLRDAIARNKEKDDFLMMHRLPIPEEDLEVAIKAYEWPRKMVEVMRDANTKVNAEHKEFEAQLKARRRDFGELLEFYGREVESYGTKNEIVKRDQIAGEVTDLAEKLKLAQVEADLINGQERLFGWAPTKYGIVAKMIATLEPYVILWTTVSQFYDKFASWMNGPFYKLNPEEVEADTNDAFRRLYKLTKVFSGASGNSEQREAPLAVAEEAKTRVQSFQEHLPLITAICNPGLRERHWAALADIVGFEIKRDEVTSLKRLLDYDIALHIAKITDISDSASREWSIEKALDKMIADWQGLTFELGPWKETGTFILKGGPVDEALGLLDDHIVKSQAMSASPFAKPFMDRLQPWERKLVRFQDILDQWLKCQGKWQYLEPIFGAEEIMKQIPREGQAFRDMDSIWRRIMEKVRAQPLMMEVADMPGLLEDLIACNQSLDVVEKGLNDFLDMKKTAFPRFFFLSNDEVLEILSEAKDPLKVQPFVKKCFEAVREFIFEKNGEISGLTSVEGEKIQWIETVNPAATGAVEKWLLDSESCIRRTLHKVAGDALEAYAKAERSRWILEWPGQIVLNCSQVYWTREVTEAIRTGGSRGLAAYAERCTLELNKIVNLVRSQLGTLERATCGALVVIDVHARDVVAAMAKDGVEDVRDFKWESQMRYYWEFNESPPSGVHPQETLVVRMINAEALYGYEYLGNSSRLVITPLTDRCYRTLMGAIHMNLGGAPAGPAGTGKTETTKDLSKALAIQCVVFNCSDGLDYKAMGRFFKGLACSGAWACFDEFNRIELEVLSVVAQQVLTIIRAKALKVKTFMFEGSEIRLAPTCNAFITMNPGYAGRSELPDNLKALFRDVAMMVPDYAMISEIILYSYGYLEARAMARKLVQTYRLCSEQLSSQDHYDYGMRAVMSVLRAAGNLKRVFPDSAEDVLMLRAINDVNLPKFLDQDVPLFNGILSDLFPGVDLPFVDYENLVSAIKDNCAKMNLQPLDSFIVKIIQLYEMIIVRHGLMLVGHSYGMKTSSYRVLAAALSDLHAKGLNKEFHTKFYVLNPKSITMGQLYGAEDPVSKEWTDGVLAVVLCNTARDTSPDRKWVIFDGPVDAIWIENMNTVLDDNKKLCLNSGEIIAMQGLMNMIFEVQDLAVASPATVSRCGMVYVQPALLGWRPVMLSWLKTLPATVTPAIKAQLVALFDWLMPPMLRVALKLVRSPQPMQDINLVSSLMRMLECHLDEFKPEQPAGVPAVVVVKDLTDAQMTSLVQGCFLFSLVWSVGGLTDEDGRHKFDMHLRKLLMHDPAPEIASFVTPGAPHKVTVPFPEGRTVYDFVFEKSRLKWVHWMETIETRALDLEAEYTTIIVPTVDTVRYTYLLNKLVTHNMHCLFVGPTGTGKTVYVKRHLQEGLPEQFTNMLMTFSAQTSANMTQDIIDGKMDKRRRGIYGPPQGKHMVVFVDDLNMPQVEEYGAQPPIELLRQFMDHGGWYDRKELTLRRLVDVQFVAAMGPPGGGRNSVTNRYLRHYSVISLTAFDTDNLSTIFTALVDWWLKKYSYQAGGVARLARPLVAASLEVYQLAQRELLPTPAKSHYTFNLRDVSKVFQGITKAAGSVEDGISMTRLWTHEVLRVFYDRLVDDTDRLWMGQTLTGLVERHFKEKISKVLNLDPSAEIAPDVMVTALRSLVFADFMFPGADPKVYAEVKDQATMQRVVTDYLADFNATSKKPMNLVIFQFALEHIARICRIITSPGGNALLVGVGGSGRQSLTRLAAFIEEYEVFQIEISKTYCKAEWHEDLKKVLRMAGEANKRVVFLFSDTQIKEESFVEDVSNLLNTYEVPNLMQSADLVSIFENIRPRAKAAGMDGGRIQLYNFFVQEVRRNMHIVLSFSPVGDTFRERLRKFPSLVNCTTIDWFTKWPTDALHTVAATFLANLVGIEERVKAQLPGLCVMFHQSVQALTDRFLAEARRYYYVTPTSYLELLLSYKSLLARRQNEVMTVKRRYEIGLEKLNVTEESVTGMKEELIALQPQLEESTRQTAAAMEVISKESVEADKVKQVVSKEEAIASAEAATVKAIKDECEADLAEAMPLLEAAIAALNTLKPADITEVKGMKSPPGGVRRVLEAICIMKGVKPIRMKDTNTGRMVDDYWEASKKMLMEFDFLDSLKKYDKDHIPPEVISRIRPFVQDPDFQPKIIEKQSLACAGLCSWVVAMEKYDKVIKEVEPKRQKLREAEAQLEVVMAALRSKQAELKQVMDKLARLDADLQDKKRRKEKLEHDVHMCTVKLQRAEKLISGLGGEKSRWTMAARGLGELYIKLTGDVLLAAGQIAYLGPFTAMYRSTVLSQWVSACQRTDIPCNDRFKLELVLGDPVKVRQWTIWGLPKDDFSTENSIAIDQGRRWPLCIDPQGLANKWIRNMEKDAGLQVIKLTDPTYLRTLENAIQFGKPVLLENVLESLDASLEPLLQKQTFKQGGAVCIRLGDATVEYSEDFKFYMTTKLRNPHYTPELCTKVALLNFMTTPEGLEDQLLGIVVAKERPDLEEEKNKLILVGAENKKRLKEIEDEILRVLSSSEGNILEDEEAVNILQSSKVLSDEISEKQQVADVTEAKIDEARAGYKPVAHHSSLLYFCVTDLANIDPMYQYSLRWFIDLFIRAIADSQRSEDLDDRLQLLNSYFTYFLYQNVCRSLFEKDKLLFAFVLASKLQMDEKKMAADELRFMTTGGVAMGDLPTPNPAPEWISERMWGEICRASDMASDKWRGLAQHVAENTGDWKRIYDSLEPHTEPLPEPWQSKLDPFQRIIVLRTIRPDKLIPALTLFVAETMGKRFVEPMPFAIEPSFNDSTATSPLIFVLSPGSDPMASLQMFADDKGIRMESVSLGQGQGPIAQRWIEQGMTDGFWVVLQNCHLAKLWLTSYPSPIFPISILENGVKMTNEAPKGLRAGLLRTYMMDPISNPEFFTGCAKDAEFRSMLFGLAFFHSILQERRKFGPIGWNIPYEFNENDLRISVRQLRMFLDEYPDIPYDTLAYTCGECNYGGKVTDSHDRHTLMTILSTYYTPRIHEPKYKFSTSGMYYPPPFASYKGYIEYINSLPLIAQPEVFGLHENADITKDLQETNLLLDSLMLTQSREATGGAASFESAVGDVAAEVLERLPPNFDIEAVERLYPQDYYNSMNTVLAQELVRFNNLLTVIRTSLHLLGKAVKGLALMSGELDAVGRALFDGKELVRFNNLLTVIRTSLHLLGKAVKGLALMSGELDAVGRALFDGKVPELWLKKSFPSLKPLGPYVKEVLERVAFFQGWVDNGAPTVFWISGFFFTQAFLTGAKQNYARKCRIPIDHIDFDFEVRDLPGQTDEAPEDGVYCQGLFLEGARWNHDLHELDESEPKVLFTPMPTIWMVPREITKFSAYPHYVCPMYKTTERRGVLSTTGHSTNFVLDVRVPSNKEPAHWTKRGVALLTSLND